MESLYGLRLGAALLPSVGDESVSPLWIVLAAVAVVAVAVVLRMRSRKDD